VSAVAQRTITLTLLKTLRSDPNLTHVRCWKQDWAAPEPAVDPVAATPAPEPGAPDGTVRAALNGGTLRRALAPLASMALHRG